MSRRTRAVFVLTTAAFVASIFAVSGTQPVTAQTPPSTLVNEGVGIYTDASVANQASGFTINPRMVSCAVGTSQLASGSLDAGPFAMLMYSTQILTYEVVPGTGGSNSIKVTGKMRSITQIGTVNQEDVVHDFVAIGADNAAPALDRFDVHFKTAFWAPGSNPMCSASAQFPGLCRFGGALVMGEVRVDPAAAAAAQTPQAVGGAPTSDSRNRLAQTGSESPIRWAALLLVIAVGALLLLKKDRTADI